MEAALYDEFARLEDHHWWFTGRRAVVREVLKRRLPKTSELQIFDVGCGTGGMIPMLQEFGQVSGMDSSEAAIQHARSRLGPGVSLVRGELPDGMPVTTPYDLITAFDVIEHIDNVPEALGPVRAVLGPDGTFVCTVPAFQFLWSHHDELNHHKRRYTRSLLEAHLTASGFRTSYVSYFNSALFLPIAAVRLLGKLLPARTHDHDHGSDLQETSPPINRLLQRIFSAERYVVPRFPLPFGVSLIAIAHPV